MNERATTNSGLLKLKSRERGSFEGQEAVATLGPAEMIGFDETIMSPASRRRRRRFVTAVVDVGSGRLPDVFEGREAEHLRAWMARMPLSWLSMIAVVPVDPMRATGAPCSTQTP